MEQMEIVQEPSPVADVTLFRLKGPFTLATMFPVQSALREPEVKGVIFDLTDVPYMDSTALGILLREYAHAQRLGHKFALVGISPRVRTIFQLTRILEVLPVFPTQADAEAGF